MTKYNVTLDAWNKIHCISVHAVQGEIASRFVDVSFTNQNTPLNLENKTVAVYMTKPDKTLIFNNCTIKDTENGIVTMALTSQMSAVAGSITDITFHVIGNDKSLLKITGMCLDIESSPDQSEAIESTNEFTALIEALSKVDGSLEYVEEFLKEKEQEIDTLKQNAEALIEQIRTDGTQAVTDVKQEGSQAIQEVNQNFNSAMTGFTQEIDAAVKKAEDAAGAAEGIAKQAAISTINTQKNQPNGIAGLNSNGKLMQMPTATDVGAVPTSRTINGKPLTSNITLTVDDIGTSTIFLVSHPVGSLFETTVSTNPGTLYGGTWAAWGGGRTPVGVNPADTDFKTVETTGGEKTHTLTVDEVAPHSHIETVYWNGGGTGAAHPAAVEAGDPRKYGGLVARTENTGGGQAHNNLQPYITCYIWKRTT